MFKNSYPSDKSVFNAGFVRRKNILTGIFILMAAFILCVLPLPERRSLASGSPTKSGSSSIAASPNPVQACPAPTNRAIGGEFDTATLSGIELPLVPVHLSVLPNEKLLFWGRDKDLTDPANPKEVQGKSEAYVWKPSEIITLPDGRRIASTTRVANSTTNLFCSGHSFLPDGRLLVSGGHKSPDFDGAGEPHINIFNYSTNSWVRAPDMNLGRWYPFNVTLATGETMIVSGSYWSNEPALPAEFASNFVPQLYTLEGNLRNLTETSPISNYPYLHLAHDGKIFYAGPIRSKMFNPDANLGVGSWTSMGNLTDGHRFGSSVMYDSNGKILLMGGVSSQGTPISNAKIIDLTVIDPALGRPKWVAVSPMNFPRLYHTATILPNGKVLVTGGTRCPGANHIDSDDGSCTAGQVMTAEMWDPVSQTWCKMADQKEIRVYHSTAVLLPDARVLVGGSGLPGAVGEIDDNGNRINDYRDANARVFGHKKVEIYSPPYLFNSNGSVAARPVINSMSTTTISYGQRFSIGVSGVGSTPKVSLVRLPSVTHGFNQDQRIVFLTNIVVTGSGIDVSAPVDANKCPPGHYMLFVLNSNGVPSVSKIIKIIQDDGYVDGIDGNQIWGWAWDKNNPNTPINVNIYEGDSLVATVAANIFRQDLLNAGKGNGVHAFVYSFPPNRFKDGQVHSVSVKFANSSSAPPTNNLGSSPRLVACAALFPTQIPNSTATGGGAVWEQATQFSSSVSGKITHIRFYKAPGETGTHIGRIWNDAGLQLAQVTFVNETASGWQTQALPTPLQINAGVRYRVTYNINNIVAKTPNALTTPISNGPLTAWTSMYSTPGGSFPNTGSTSNLFADVLFNVPK